MKLSVAVLAFNEANSLSVLIPRLYEVCEPLTQDNFEIVVIDDASVDRTPELVAAMTQYLPRVRTVRHDKNQGYAFATRSAMGSAQGDFIVVIDGDGQHTPDQVERIYEHFMRSPVDIIFPQRTVRAEPWTRKVASRVLTSQCKWLLGFPGRDVNGGIKGIRKSVVPRIEIRHQMNLVNPELWVRCRNGGLDFDFISVEQRPRMDGTQSRVVARPAAMLRDVSAYIMTLRGELE